MLKDLSLEERLWITASDVPETKTDWLWWPYIAAEHINIIAGMGNEGKGLVCMHLAACVTKGRAFPLCAEKHEPGNVLWCEMEDDISSTIIPRMKAAGCDMQRIKILNPDEFLKISNQQHVEILENAIEDFQPRLIVLSPMNSFLGPININSEVEVRAAFERLRMPTVGTGCAIIGIAHANKKTELSAIERISGSVAYVNYCRSVILVTAENDQTRRFIHGKWNNSTKSPDLLYTPYYNGTDPRKRDQHVRLKWDAPLNDVDHKKAFNIPTEAEADKEKAPQWLERILQEKGPMAIAELKELCAKAGFKWRAVEVARQRMNERNDETYIDSLDSIWTLAKRSR